MRKYTFLTILFLDFSKNGELEALRFSGFRQELLQQNYWSPADDLGRIKIVLSEGFPRDSISMPFERVKNIVAFSFQHAPLGIPPCVSTLRTLSHHVQIFWKVPPLPGQIPLCGGELHLLPHYRFQYLRPRISTHTLIRLDIGTQATMVTFQLALFLDCGSLQRILMGQRCQGGLRIHCPEFNALNTCSMLIHSQTMAAEVARISTGSLG